MRGCRVVPRVALSVMAQKHGVVTKLTRLAGDVEKLLQLTVACDGAGTLNCAVGDVCCLSACLQVVKDLLNPSDKQLMIREHPEMGIYVQDLAELVVKNAEDVARLLEQGQKVRHVAATAMNDRSSRSHSCFTLKIEQKQVERLGDKEKTTTWNAKINLVGASPRHRC